MPRPITTAELELMQQLREEGLTYRQIAAKTGRTYNGVRISLDPVAREKSRASTAARRKRMLEADSDAYYAHANKTHRAYHQRNPELKMLYSAKESAKNKGVPFDLTKEDIVIPEVCPVFGIPLEKAAGSRTDASPSLDRMVPALGYVKGNVQVISWRANKLKQEGTAEEHRLIAEWMASHGIA